MPIYAYKCSNCGHEMDSLQKISDAPLSVCPSCGEAALVKQVTAAGFQLKGSGWYATDFRNGTPKKDAAGAPAKTDAAADSKAASGDSKAGGDAGGSKETSGSKDASSKESSSPAPAKSTEAAPSKAPPPASKPD